MRNGTDEEKARASSLELARDEEGRLQLEFCGAGTKYFPLTNESVGGLTRVTGRLVQRSGGRISMTPLRLTLRDEDGMALCVSLAGVYGIRLFEFVDTAPK